MILWRCLLRPLIWATLCAAQFAVCVARTVSMHFETRPPSSGAGVVVYTHHQRRYRLQMDFDGAGFFPTELNPSTPREVWDLLGPSLNGRHGCAPPAPFAVELVDDQGRHHEFAVGETLAFDRQRRRRSDFDPGW
jgi:hypothetical protein